MANLFKIIQVNFSKHGGNYVNAQGLLTIVDVFLVQLVLHLFEKWNVYMLLSIITLSPQLLDLCLVKLRLHHE